MIPEFVKLDPSPAPFPAGQVDRLEAQLEALGVQATGYSSPVSVRLSGDVAEHLLAALLASRSA